MKVRLLGDLREKKGDGKGLDELVVGWNGRRMADDEDEFENGGWMDGWMEEE